MAALKIIASGPGWLVVDKACDVSVHNEPGRDLVSLVRARIEGDAELVQCLAYEKGATISPVHRLDRETSGVMVLGVDPETARWLSSQFEERRICKQYVAVVHGCFGESIGSQLIWDRPLSPEAGGREKPAGGGRKVPCTTRIQLLGQSLHYALIACTLVTAASIRSGVMRSLPATPFWGIAVTARNGPWRLSVPAIPSPASPFIPSLWSLNFPILIWSGGSKPPSLPNF